MKKKSNNIKYFLPSFKIFPSNSFVPMFSNLLLYFLASVLSFRQTIFVLISVSHVEVIISGSKHFDVDLYS